MRTLVVLGIVAIFACEARGSEEDDINAARVHFKKGSKAFDLGRYIEAAKEYEAAFDAREDPALLYNIAQAYRLGGDNSAAVRAYRAFLRRMPKAPNRVEVEARITELQKVIDQQEKAKTGTPDGTLPPSGKDLKGPATPTNGATTSTTSTTKTTTTEKTTSRDVPVHKKWWFWVAVGGGVVAVALAVGLGVGLSSKDGFVSTLDDTGPGRALTVTW